MQWQREQSFLHIVFIQQLGRGLRKAEGKEYVVCHDCSNEFVTAFADTADKQTCSGCQEEKICGKYIIDGQEYFVCPDNYEEFAHGMKLEE